MKILKKSKQEQGITLIALVVTIIVLLILTGVTISAVLGENGLVQKAKRATQVHQNAVITENNQMNNAANFINSIANNDPQEDEEKWWLPTADELAELRESPMGVGEEGPHIGYMVGYMVTQQSVSFLQVGVVSDYNIWYFVNQSSKFGFYDQQSLNNFITNLDSIVGEAFPKEAFLTQLQTVNSIPCWVDTNGVSYTNPINFDQLTTIPSQTYFNRIRAHLENVSSVTLTFVDEGENNQVPSIIATPGSPITLPVLESSYNNEFGRMVYKRRRWRKRFC